jgi:hypothetical protein
MALEMMKELFSAMHIRDDQEGVPNAKCMRVGEKEVLLSQFRRASLSRSRRRKSR